MLLKKPVIQHAHQIRIRRFRVTTVLLPYLDSISGAGPERCLFTLFSFCLDLCSDFMVIKQWGFFSVPHLFWHGTFVYNVRLRGPVTLTPISERLAAELSLPVFTTSSVRLGFEHPTFRMRGEHYEPWPLRHGREVCLHKEWDTYGMRCIGFGFVFWFFLIEFYAVSAIFQAMLTATRWDA